MNERPKTSNFEPQKQTKQWGRDIPEKSEIEDEPPSEIYSDMFSIDMAPPSFGAPPPVATFAIHEPTDLKWDPNSDDQVGSPRKEESENSSRNEFMAPVENKQDSDDGVVSSPTEASTSEFATREGEDLGVHQKSDQRDAFNEFGSQSEDANHEEVNVNKNTLQQQSEENSDAFMTPPEKIQQKQPKVHRKGKESYGNVVSEMSFFEKFGSERSTEPAPIRSTEVRSIPSMRAPDPLPHSKISTLVSPEEVRSIPQHRQKQASIGFAISELSFSQKFEVEDNDDPPPVFSVTEDVNPPFDIGEEASTSEISGNNENEDMEILRQEMKILRDQLEEAHQKIKEQQMSLTSTETELQACKDSKIRLIISSSNEITRLTDTIGILAKLQRK